MQGLSGLRRVGVRCCLAMGDRWLTHAGGSGPERCLAGGVAESRLWVTASEGVGAVSEAVSERDDGVKGLQGPAGGVAPCGWLGCVVMSCGWLGCVVL